MRALLVVLVILTGISCSTFQKGERFDLRSYNEYTLKNGLRILLIEDSGLPYISYIMMVRSGSSSDPENNSGLSSIVASLLDKGSSRRSAVEIADSLGHIGADFGASVFSDYTFVSASALSFHNQRLLEDFAEIVTEPTFSQAEVDRVKARTRSSLQRRADQPDGFASLAFSSFLYENHPYARDPIGKLVDLDKISRRNIIRHYLQSYRPNNAILAVVGNFSSDIKTQLEENFGSWEPRDLEPMSYPPFPKIEGLNIQLVHKPDLQQSQIRFGHKGIQRNDPDFLVLRVANTILGGAFSSRLVDKVREAKGLTYSIHSSFDAREDYGPFVISTFTRNDKIEETISATLEALKEFVAEGVTDEEVNSAKALLKGMFPRAIETPELLAQNLLILRYHKIPDSYLRNYFRDIERISTVQVNRAIRQHFDPENMKILVYSQRAAALEQLKKFGEVQERAHNQAL